MNESKVKIEEEELKNENVDSSKLENEVEKTLVSENEEKTIEKESSIADLSAHLMLVSIIQKQKEKEEQNDIWKDSPYKDLEKLQSNNVGNVGEELIGAICKVSNIQADCNGTKTKKIGGGKGDGTINNIVVEIKTAHQGSTSPTFQHELGEIPWKQAKYMMLLKIILS